MRHVQPHPGCVHLLPRNPGLFAQSLRGTPVQRDHETRSTRPLHSCRCGDYGVASFPGSNNNAEGCFLVLGGMARFAIQITHQGVHTSPSLALRDFTRTIQSTMRKVQCRRRYPDVSANGAFLLTFVNLTMETYFGTSLASPIFGSVITLINEARTNVSKGPIGFNNHALYESR